MANVSTAALYQPEVPDTSSPGFPTTPLVIILSFLSFGTVLGNSLVCLAIFIHPALHSVTYLSIFSLAVADLLVGLVATPSYITKKLVTAEPIATVVCDMFRFSYFITGYASILSLCVISAERLSAIKRPLTYMTVVTRPRVTLVLILIWIDTLVVSSLPFFPWPGDHSDECHYSPRRWWSIMVIILNVIIPFFFIVTCYAIIYSVARVHIRKISSDRTISLKNDRGQFRRAANERRANTTIIIVIGVFVVSWFPSSIYYFIGTTCPSCFPESFYSVKSLVNASVKILTFASSFFNPLIYCWRSKEFRSAFVKILLRNAYGRRFSDAMRSSFNSDGSRKKSRAETITSLSKQHDDDAVVTVLDDEGTGTRAEDTRL